ncbi:MAG: DUF2892 domain-containing protein [Bergeyella sp.]|nr:DUF2892 domain-containing protein [Bergeyella sp.]
MNKYIKIFVAAVLIILGVYMMFFTRNVGWGVVVFLLSGILVFMFFKNEYILMSFWFLRKQKIGKAVYWLGKIRNYTSQLHKSQYGYYHYLKGLCLAQEHPSKMEPLMRKALEYGLNMKQDRAMAYLNLAAVAISKGRKQEGQKFLEESRKLDKAGLMTEQIKAMKDQLKMPSMQKHMHNPHMRKRGKFF